VHPYTFRAENQFLPFTDRADIGVQAARTLLRAA
jgi:hypothetical protein